MPNHIKKLSLLVGLAVLIMVCCRCCSARYNQPLVGKPVPRPTVLLDDSTLMYVCFSGGGTRAMAMGYYVVDELAKIPYSRVVRGPGIYDTITLRDAIDYTSGVSGGSFVSAGLAAYSQKEWSDFYKRAVARDIQGGILLRMFEPWNWPKLMSPYYNRTDLASEFYDHQLFKRMTFGTAPARPVLYINSTLLALGTHWVYDDEYFRYINSDIRSYPLGFACAGSSAFPVAFAPMTLRNYALYTSPESLSSYPKYKYAKLNAEADDDAYNFASTYEFLKDSANRWLHVSDGGIAGNTGIERILDDFQTNGPINKAINNADRPLKRLIFVVVNAGATQPDSSCTNRLAPNPLDVVMYTINTALDEVDEAHTTALRARAEELWQAAEASQGKVPSLALLERPYVINLDAENLKDLKLLDDFESISTTFDLPAAQLNTIHQAVLRLMADDPELARLKASISKTK